MTLEAARLLPRKASRAAHVGRFFGAVAVLAGGLLASGCGPYEPEPEFPRASMPAPPPPPTAEELAAREAARAREDAESADVALGATEDEYADTDPSALTEFRETLEGHGRWVEDSYYGVVWVPSKEEVGEEFQPYVTAGHWTYSEATDYVWVSDYTWGWAPFHYGRWVFLPGHGWSWIPGRRYAGAWVTWRVGPSGYGYVGWAPAPPDWYWWNGAALGWSFGFYRHHDHYVYCPWTHVHHPVVSTHVVRGPRAREHDGRTQDYAIARPTVGGPRTIATPTVGGRAVASPSVTGERVEVTPTPGRAAMGPSVATRGPRPEELGARNVTVVAPPSSHEGLGRAKALAIPASAVAIGAAAPAPVRRPSLGRLPADHPSSMASVLPPSAPRLQMPRFTPAPPAPVERPSASYSARPTPSLTPTRPTPSFTPPPSFAPSRPTPSLTPTRPTPSFTPSRPTPSITPSRPTPSFTPSRPTPSITPSRPTPSFAPSRPSPSFSPLRPSSPARSGGVFKR